MSNLVDSLTDLYESDYQDGYDNFHRSCHYPHFEVVIALENGTNIVIKSDSNYHCWIPWNIEYNGKTYVQYNGEIPSALLKILAYINKANWSGYNTNKLTRWGCYAAPVPERYEKISPDFPASTPVILYQQIVGKSHLVWDTNVKGTIIDSPQYVDNTVLVETTNRVIAFDSKTGAPVWDVNVGSLSSNMGYADGNVFVATTERACALDLKTGENMWKKILPTADRWFFHFPRELVVCEGVVYISSKGPVVCSLDAKTGKVLWKYHVLGNAYADMHLWGDYCIIAGKGITCLNKKTGKRVWGITDYVSNIQLCDDKILYDGREEDYKQYSTLVDIPSGEILWKAQRGDAVYPRYKDGVLYFGNPKKSEITALTVETMEKVWSYPYRNSLGHLKVFEEKILVVLFREEKKRQKYLDNLVLLDKNGSKIWEYIYSGEQYYSPYFHIVSDTLLYKRKGLLEAFNVHTGKKMWEREVRGTLIHSLEVYKDFVYVAVNDGRFYCLDIKTGRIIWFYELQKEIFMFFEGAHLMASSFNEGVAFVATREGGVFAFSHAETPFSLTIPHKGSSCIE